MAIINDEIISEVYDQFRENKDTEESNQIDWNKDTVKWALGNKNTLQKKLVGQLRQEGRIIDIRNDFDDIFTNLLLTLSKKDEYDPFVVGKRSNKSATLESFVVSTAKYVVLNMEKEKYNRKEDFSLNETIGDPNKDGVRNERIDFEIDHRTSAVYEGIMDDLDACCNGITRYCNCGSDIFVLFYIQLLLQKHGVDDPKQKIFYDILEVLGMSQTSIKQMLCNGNTANESEELAKAITTVDRDIALSVLAKYVYGAKSIEHMVKEIQRDQEIQHAQIQKVND